MKINLCKLTESQGRGIYYEKNLPSDSRSVEDLSNDPICVEFVKHYSRLQMMWRFLNSHKPDEIPPILVKAFGQEPDIDFYGQPYYFVKNEQGFVLFITFNYGVWKPIDYGYPTDVVQYLIEYFEPVYNRIKDDVDQKFNVRQEARRHLKASNGSCCGEPCTCPIQKVKV